MVEYRSKEKDDVTSKDVIDVIQHMMGAFLPDDALVEVWRQHPQAMPSTRWLMWNISIKNFGVAPISYSHMFLQDDFVLAYQEKLRSGEHD